MKINYEIPDDLHKAVRILAAHRETTIKALLIEALQRLVEEDDKEKENKK